ncbi:pyridoxamine 5'-phosphate oxidase [Marinospirillum sp.]|uniref:pyridoxamine 5'-phosphate oxidase n=1 Tax=Marinospirillum sp. TaxID=2183934 RepID=UPI003A8938C3
MNQNLEALRRTYDLDSLDEHKAGDCPFALFTRWLQDALSGEVLDPNAMTVTTVDAEGQPKARTLLLKGFSAEQGWIFYTNYLSDKGRELAANPRCSLLFWWEQQQRQVRIEGRAIQLDPAQSEAYFQSRPRESQIGAWASEQSQVIASRATLTERQAMLEEQFKDCAILPRPEHWGGYRIEAQRVEFWQGQPSRLHDRLNFIRTEDGWKRERLAP